MRNLAARVEQPWCWFKGIARRVFPGGGFSRGVAVLASGTVAGQAIIVLSSPLLTRLYTPEEMGVFATFSSVLSIAGSVATLRYALAIPLPEKDQDAVAVATVSVGAALMIGLVTWGGVVLFGNAVASAMNVAALQPYLWLLPIGVTLAGLYEVGYYFATRFGDFGSMARTKWSQSLGMVGVQLGGSHLGSLALLLGRLVGQSGGTLVLWKRGLARVRESAVRVDLSSLMWAAKRYSQFPMLSTSSAVLNTVGTQLPPLLFSALFGPAAAGVYMLSQRVLAMPMTLLGRAVSDVLFSRAADGVRTRRIDFLVGSVYEFLAHLAMPPILVLMLAAPDLFSLGFGEQWRQAGEFAQWMAPWMYVVFVASPLRSLLVVMEKQGQSLVFEVVLLSVRVSSLVVAGGVGNLGLAVALFSLGSALCWFGLLVWILRTANCSARAMLAANARALGWAILAVVPLLATGVTSSSGQVSYYALATAAVLIAVRYSVLLRGMLRWSR